MDDSEFSIVFHVGGGRCTVIHNKALKAHIKHLMDAKGKYKKFGTSDKGVKLYCHESEYETYKRKHRK